jgi:hypothetical protein
MSTGFLALACFSGSIVLFAFSILLQRSAAPVTHADYSPERQKKLQTARWTFFSVGAALLVAAILLELAGIEG